MIHDEETPIKAVWFHKAVMVPGVIGSETSLTEVKYPGIKLFLTPHDLIIKFKGIISGTDRSNVSAWIFDHEKVEAKKIIPIKK